MPRKTPHWLPSTARLHRFNEAAARCRGKPTAPAANKILLGEASMRPRPDAAENLYLMLPDPRHRLWLQ